MYSHLHNLSLSLSLSLYSFSNSHSIPLTFAHLYRIVALLIHRCIFGRIWDDDLCHYLLIHEYTRGRVRVAYVSLTCVYSFTYEWEWSKIFKEHACKYAETSFRILNNIHNYLYISYLFQKKIWHNVIKIYIIQVQHQNLLYKIVLYKEIMHALVNRPPNIACR